MEFNERWEKLKPFDKNKIIAKEIFKKQNVEYCEYNYFTMLGFGQIFEKLPDYTNFFIIGDEYFIDFDDCSVCTKGKTPTDAAAQAYMEWKEIKV